MHPLTRLHHHRAQLADEAGFGDQLAAVLVDSAIPALKARLPELAEGFVEAALPRVQAKLVDLEPQLRELAAASANAVLSDPQIQETIKSAVKEQADKAEAKLRMGFLKTIGAILAGVLVIEIAEPWLPGRPRVR